MDTAQEEPALPTGKNSSNFRAEAEALCAASTAISENADRTTGQVVLFSGALSVLQSTKSSRNKETNALTTALVALNNAQTVVM